MEAEGAVTAFEQANPGITVQVENSGFSSYWDKLATPAANDAPDVIRMDESYIAAYGGRSALLDLSLKSSVLDLSAMDAKVLDTASRRHLVGAPVGIALLGWGQSGAAETGRREDAGRQDLDLGRPRRPRPSPRRLGSKGVVGMDFFGLKRRGDRCLGTPAQPRVFPTED